MIKKPLLGKTWNSVSTEPPYKVSGDDRVPRAVQIIEEAAGLVIVPEGLGDCTSEDGAGAPIFLEHHEGKWRLHVWADINDEEATNRIDLSGALEDRRKE